MIKKDYIIPFIGFLAIIALILKGPIPQNEVYHDFADKRKLFDIPNFLNVVTNLPFTLVGVLGLLTVRRLNERKLKLITSTLFFSFLVLTFGSGYYHLWPRNNSLVYDRIPISVILMSFFAFIIYDWVDREKGYLFFFVLNIAGIASVIYWGISESIGMGDLRWYGLVQFYPIIAIPIITWLHHSSLNRARQLIPIFIFFAVAKLAEKFDKELYHLLNNTLSGHSLKHIVMSIAGYQIVVMMRRRVKIEQQ